MSAYLFQQPGHHHQWRHTSVTNVLALLTWNNDHQSVHQYTGINITFHMTFAIYLIFLATCKINYTPQYVYACGSLWLPSNTTGTRVFCIKYVAEMTRINAIGLGRQQTKVVWCYITSFKARWLHSPFDMKLTLQNYDLSPLKWVHIWPVAQQLSCSYICKTWIWHPIGNQYSIILKNLEYKVTAEIDLITTTPAFLS